MWTIGGMLEDQKTTRDTAPKLKLTQFHTKYSKIDIVLSIVIHKPCEYLEGCSMYIERCMQII